MSRNIHGIEGISEDLAGEGVAEVRAVWLLIGLLGAAVNVPFTPLILLANGIPWIVVALLLFRGDTASRVLGFWRQALSSRSGAWGISGVVLVVSGVAAVVAGSAGLLLAIWLAAMGTLIALFRGSSTLREQLGKWALLGLTMCVVVLLAEGILRWKPMAERMGTPAEVESWYHRYDRVWERNVLGIRSPHEILRKETGVLRVVAIGDSFTWGDKIANSDSTWPAQLEQTLRRRLPTIPVEVVNLGQNGFTTVNGAEMLRRLGWQFDPDIVVVQFYLNDILPSGPDFSREYSGWLFPRAWILPQRYRGGAAGASALLQVAESGITALRHGDRAGEMAQWTDLYQRQGAEWVAMASAVREMGAAAAQRKVPIVLMLFPDFFPGLGQGDALPFGAINQQVARAAEDAGFSILDLTSSYLQEGGDLGRWWATPYDAHPSIAAAGVAARSLAEYLLEAVGLKNWKRHVPEAERG